MSNLHILAGSCAILALPACATQSEMPPPDLKMVKVETIPSGVTATSYNGARCITPCMLSLSSSRGGVITLEKKGYAVEQRYVTAGLGRARPNSTYLFGSYGPEIVEPEIDPGDAMIQYRFHLSDPSGPLTDLDVRRVLVKMVPEGDSA